MVQTPTPTPTDEPTDRPEVMTVPEVAAYLRVSQETIRVWLREGKLRGLKAPGAAQHRWRIRRADIDQLGS